MYSIPRSHTALFGMDAMTIEEDRALEISWYKSNYTNPIQQKFATFEWTIQNNIYGDLISFHGAPFDCSYEWNKTYLIIVNYIMENIIKKDEK